jgi:hypothetical protein
MNTHPTHTQHNLRSLPLRRRNSPRTALAVHRPSISWNLERKRLALGGRNEKTREKRAKDADAGRSGGARAAQQRVRMERWHEREAEWDEINKGKDSPSRVQDKDGMSPYKAAGTTRGAGGEGGSAARPAPAAARGILRAPARNERSIWMAFPRLTNVEGAICARGQQDGDSVVSVLAPVLAPVLVFSYIQSRGTGLRMDGLRAACRPEACAISGRGEFGPSHWLVEGRVRGRRARRATMMTWHRRNDISDKRPQRRGRGRSESREDAGCLPWKNLRAGEP